MMIFSGSAVVDREQHERALRDGRRRPVVPRGHLHGPRPRQADPEPRVQQRPRPHVDEVRGQPGHRSRPRRTSATRRSSGTSRRAAGCMVTVLADQHKVRFFGSPDLKRWETLSDFGPAGATGGVWECPDLFPLPVEGEPATSRWVLDVDINPGARRRRLGRAVLRRHASTARASSTTTRRIRRSGSTTARTSTPRSPSRTCPPADGRRIWMGWISNWLYANEEPTVDVARRAVGPARRSQLRACPKASGSFRRRSPSSTRLRTGRGDRPSPAARAPAAGADMRVRDGARRRGRRQACACPTPRVRRC